MSDGGRRDPARRLLEWLEPRLEEVPAELAGAVRDAVDRAAAALEGADGGEAVGAGPEPLPDPASVPDSLAWIAVRELDRVADAPQDREAALRLLAADAALTWAFEAAAEVDEELEGLADRAGLHGRIGRLLDRPGGPRSDRREPAPEPASGPTAGET